MDAWLTAALPFWTAALTQVLGAIVRLGTSQASRSHFEGLEANPTYVPPDRKAEPSFTPVAERQYLRAAYHSENIGKVFAKNGDAATLLMGLVAMLTTALATWPAVTGVSILLGLVALTFGIWRAVHLLRLPPEKYSPRIHDKIQLSSTVVILTLAFVVSGALAALSVVLGIPSAPVPSPVSTP